MNYPVITFIGAGNMASSLIGGLIANDYPSDKIWASNPSVDKLNRLKDCFHINVTQDNHLAARKADILVLAVKPTMVETVMTELKTLLQSKTLLVISVVTGVTCDSMVTWSQCPKLPVVRCMPNTPALLRSGVTGLYANIYVNQQQRATAESILRAVGVILWLENEEDLDTVTAVSGSGPAYFFLIMEAMLDCAKQMGLNEQKAKLLTVHTALGAARMALESGKDIAALRRQVTSPGGTTEQAIKVFEAGGIRDLFFKALTAAKKRAVEMSKLLD